DRRRRALPSGHVRGPPTSRRGQARRPGRRRRRVRHGRDPRPGSRTRRLRPGRVRRGAAAVVPALGVRAPAPVGGRPARRLPGGGRRLGSRRRRRGRAPGPGAARQPRHADHPDHRPHRRRGGARPPPAVHGRRPRARRPAAQPRHPQRSTGPRAGRGGPGGAARPGTRCQRPRLRRTPHRRRAAARGRDGRRARRPRLRRL
ncbi:MAG: Transmembrane component BioN of energizing module of biotin ECF transporter, partial [uncultured Nocardioides sp.]